jgi:ABC-2 type transport system ATP-binding protein
MILLKADKLTVSYGRREALRELDLSVPGGVVGLLGPNGAGKSTLLKTVLGWLAPSRGAIEVLGRPVATEAASLRARLGYFPERSVVLPGLSAVETVALAGEIGGLPRSESLARAHDMLWFAGLGDARYRLLSEFSTGMRQRAKLAMALVHDPELVLLDEPTSGLDPSGRRHMLELVREVGARGVSVLLSTHLLHDVEQVCESVVVLDRGRLALEGRLDALRSERGGAYEVRVRETSPGSYLRALAERNIPATEDEDGLLRVTLDEPSTRPLFELARGAGAEIRHLRPIEASLETRFLSAVDDRKRG